MKHPLRAWIALGALFSCADEPITGVDIAESQNKITICHRGHAISVSRAAWKAHQAHGDTLGACGGGCPSTAGVLTVADFRADQGVATDASGYVSVWTDQSGNGHDAASTLGPRLVTDALGRSVLRFEGDGRMLIAAPHVPPAGTLFIVFGGIDSSEASGIPIGWGNSAVGDHGVDVLPFPGFGVDAVIRNNSEIGDLLSMPSAATMEVDTVTWGPAGLRFERRFADGTTSSCFPGSADCISSSAITTVSDGGFALHLGSSGDGGYSFRGDLAQLIVHDGQLGACERTAIVDALATRWLRLPPPPVCGDGVLAGAEQCDDGNTSDGDGCSSSCVVEVVPSCFTSSDNKDAGPFPNQVAIGDLDGDGTPDLAAAIGNGQYVSVMHGNGNGTFGDPITFGASSNGGPYGIAIGDLNGDARPDLVAVGINGASVLLGNGDGTFQPAVDHDAGLGAFAVAIGDLDGDARADLVIANPGFGVISIVFGNGDGTFQAPVAYSVPPSPRSIAIADFNGDGTPDLAVATWSSAVAILLGHGDGTFAPPVEYPAGSASYSVVVADFNGDAKLDLAVANHDGGDVSVLLGAGNGTFGAPANYVAGGYPFAIATGFANGDSTLDLVVATLYAVAVLRGNGDGSFRPAVEYAVPGNPVGVSTGDLNGDARTDIVVANANNGPVSVLLNAAVNVCE